MLPFIIIALNNADIEKTILSNLNQRFPLTNAQYVCDFSRLNLTNMPVSDSVAIDGYGKDKPKGLVVIRLSFFRNGERVFKTAGTVNVGILKKVMSAAMPIKGGEKLTTDKIIFETRDVSSLNDASLDSLPQLDGKIAAKFIQSGATLTASMLASPPLVNPGDQVEIQFSNGDITLRTRGIVKDKGSSGSRVRVMNVDTRKVIRATVIDKGLVAINNKEGE